MSEERPGSERGSAGPDAPADRQRRDQALFDAVASSWCRKDLAPASRLARRHRLDRTLRAVPLAGLPRVLEIGCGAGFAARYLAGRYAAYTGIDPSARLIDLARTHNDVEGAEFLATDAASFEPDAPYDLVFMIGVLHHIPEVDGVMPHIGALLRPGGWLAVNEPQPANPVVRLARAVRRRVERAYSDEQDQLSAGDLRRLLDRAGLEDVRIRPQGLFSTPFAEVVLRPALLARALAPAACGLDAVLETAAAPILRGLSWNLVAAGRRPRGA